MHRSPRKVRQRVPTMLRRVLASGDDGGSGPALCERSVQHREKGALERPVLVVGEPHDLTTNVATPSGARSVLRPIQHYRVDGDPNGGRPTDEGEQLGGPHMRLARGLAFSGGVDQEAPGQVGLPIRYKLKRQ